MASATQLMANLADSLAFEFAAVRERYRVLRDAGLISKQKAGRGGGAVSIRDATNLLLAVAGTGRASRSCYPVVEHGACLTEEGPWQLQSLNLPRVKALPAEHSLADILDSLIASGIDGDIDPQTGSIRSTCGDAIAGPLSVEVVLFEPLVWTEVRIGLGQHDADGSLVRVGEEIKRYKQIFGHKGELAYPPFQAHAPSDLSHQHRFTEQSLMNLAGILKGD